MAGRTTTLLVSFFIAMATMSGRVRGHGYMLEPPSRQSAIRVGYSNIPRNYDDNALYCGAIAHQWDVNGGKCGVCGDPWDETPRSYEHPDGRYVKGVDPVNKVYAMGQTVEVIIRQTTGHRGYHIFRLCNRDNLDSPDATEDCLQQNVLHLENGATKVKEADFCNGIYKFKVKLPVGLTCEKCFFQWKYRAGQHWGCFQDGRCCLGCGEKQEEFYACADIVIRDDVPVTSPLSGYPASCALSSANNASTTTTTTQQPHQQPTTKRPTTPTTSTTPATTTTTQATKPTTTATTTTTKTSTLTTTTTTAGDSVLERRCRGSLCWLVCNLSLYYCNIFSECRGCSEYLALRVSSGR
ncbi:uncharacterized protein [Littorina saxatilis]|uniref:uncharacterized protein n=1 Tax=Littorina saxatilis TaxID=31220 RepID=UPI0038B429E8